VKVKVFNDNVHDFKQNFRGEAIYIPAKGFVEMDQDDAHTFQSQYYPPEVDAGGAQKPESFKMLRVEGGNTTPTLDPWTCQACGYKGISKKDLSDHVSARLHLNDGHKHLENETAASAEEIVAGIVDNDEVMTLLAEKMSAAMAAKNKNAAVQKTATKPKEA